ncbi:ribosome biogenesis GTPase Der [Agaribacterium haliotis]|uniref:ribosome biogenesis GTPase Der n=1 Tax=Agaribacterium haliotis TaxID=2013869 RepID=UPI000BB56AB0|nr:ribosome biogenesis GTPase Der [Agaribacterium haliotis]
MLATVALVGRPNVGKSTLFNRLTKTRDALVANHAGLTRDRKYGELEIGERRYLAIDTGGLSGEEEGIDLEMAGQSYQAIEEADLVLFLVDCKDGITSADEEIAEHLRRNSKKVVLVANKVDGQNEDVVVSQFYELGFSHIVGTAAAQGRGLKSLQQAIVEAQPDTVVVDEAVSEAADPASKGIRIAVVGRPNVGKSTLVNRMLGEDRVVVFDMPGTTRDSVYIPYEREGEAYTLIDTAGVRRRKNIKLSVEKFSIVKTLQAIDDANVVILVVDAQEGIVEQDLHLLGHVIDTGKALVIALNKWDGLDSEHKAYVKTELERRLRFVDFADMHFISALHGTGVGHLYQSIKRSYQSATEKFSTSFLTKVLEHAVSEHQPPLVQGRRIKLRYAHSGGHNPPIIVIHGNQTRSVPGHYHRYLEKTFRRALDLHGTPVRIEFKTADNPFEGKKAKIKSNRQQKLREQSQQKKGGRNTAPNRGKR